MPKAKLVNVEINKYKSIETKQSFDVHEHITTIVGKNESGKSAILEAIAKSQYFEEDPKFEFDPITDYPRKEKKSFDKAGENVTVITCTYELSAELIKDIQEDVGPKAFTKKRVTHSRSYLAAGGTSSIIRAGANLEAFLRYKLGQYAPKDQPFEQAVQGIKTLQDIDSLLQQHEDHQDFLQGLQPYFVNTWNWADPISEYVARRWIKPALPKFMYYSEFYALPSEVEIRKLQQNAIEEEHLKTSKALFELADINVQDLLNDENYEAYKAELEATSNEITEKLFEYWQTNANLRVEFDIHKKVKQLPNNQKDIFQVLKIRVYSQKYGMSLPLASRSKGFNWFFSFIVWFSKIQEDQGSDYILLLDEPGLNLHATAQSDLLRFIEDLAQGKGGGGKSYQVIYTTHSPFMVDSNYLERVRTVLETDQGTKISESIQEKDPDTLFPLQAALGYDLAQNLFVSKNNLLIEGPSDLIYLETMSELLKSQGRTGLRDDITLVPAGGLDKVTAFISLLRGQKLNIACLLDTFTDQKGKARLEDLVQQKIIKGKNVRFFDEFVDASIADIEDLFEPSEYLEWFNAAFGEHEDVTPSDLESKKERLVERVAAAVGVKRFNHYRPAIQLSKAGVSKTSFSAGTLDRFEAVFKAVNALI